MGKATSKPEQVPGQDDRASGGTRRPINETNNSGAEGLSSLGVSHFQEFERHGQLEDIKKAIECLARAADMTPIDHSDMPIRLSNLGRSYHARFLRLGELEDIEQAILHLARAVTLIPEGHANLPGLLSSIGSCYSNRYNRFGTLDDLTEAINYQIRALNLTPDGHGEIITPLNNLGLSYRARFRRLGELDDIQRAIEYLSRAVSLTPDDHSSLPPFLTNLGLSYSDRFDRSGALDDLHKTVEYLTRAIDLTPDNHPGLPMRLSNLGLAYRSRFMRIGELGDVDQAITHISRAVTLTPEGHSNLPVWLNNLGSCYSDRFDRLGKLDDLVMVIEYRVRAVNLTPEDHPELSTRLNNLGMSYRARSLRLGKLDDAEQAITHLSRAVASTPTGHTSLPSLLNNLGLSYSDRFHRLGTLGDLVKAIEYGTRTVNLTPDGHPGLPMRLNNLGMLYRNRFQHLGEPNDIDQAIAHISRAVALTPEGHPNLSALLSDLGYCHSQRYERLGTLDDLKNTIKFASKAVDLTPVGHSDLPARLSILGISYRNRFLRQGKPADLEKATKRLSRALKLTPDDHPVLSLIYRNFSMTSYSQYQQSGDPSHLQSSIDYFRKASLLMTGPPRDRFQCAIGWAWIAFTHSNSGCIEAYQTIMEMLPQYIWLGAPRTQRYRDLTTAENLAVNAAAAAIRYSGPALALEWLEQARCVVWTQSLSLSSPFDQLHSSHPELATRLQTVAKQLQEAGFDTSGSQTQALGSDDVEKVGRQRRNLATEYGSLLSEARTLSGFEEFLRPMKSKDFIRASRNGPVVVINCHEQRCDALIIIPGKETIENLPLPEYNQEKARNARSKLETSLRNKGIRQRGFKVRQAANQKDEFAGVLLDLWTYVIKPILDFLKFTNGIPTESLPHITWCPTGPMSFLPLHAAGDYNKPQSCVFDYAISSYTPTLTALLSTSSTSLTGSSRVLAIGQTNTPGQSPLPGTAKELECVKDATKNKAEYSQLTGNKATVTAVLDAMERHDWVHLACHAHQNVSDPTKSGFFLHDGTLDLASINRRSFKNKGLAFLSACQTATGDEKLPDEAIHLASGMLMAGYQSVIATMWSVYDDDAPIIADKVYTQLMQDGKVGNGEAGKALHYALSALREKVGQKEFAHWAPYIHIGS